MESIIHATGPQLLEAPYSNMDISNENSWLVAG